MTEPMTEPMTGPLVATAVSTPEELAAAYALRYAVFVEEQGVPLDIERDAEDETADHVLVLRGDRVVGTGRLVDAGAGVAVLGRIAVSMPERGTGAGALVVAALEERARERAMTSVELHAQTSVVGFYLRLGYVAFGSEYEEAGIPHVSMRKPLD